MTVLAVTLLIISAINIYAYVSNVGKTIEATAGGALLSVAVNGSLMVWIALVML